jgi:hypothetical protein
MMGPLFFVFLVYLFALEMVKRTSKEVNSFSCAVVEKVFFIEILVLVREIDFILKEK